jgi:hypothetical protein
MGTSPTIMSLLLNCQWIKCIGDIINKYNDVIDVAIFLILILFVIYFAKKKTTGIKSFILVCTNFLALFFSITALCMTHPNQLGFDYIGAIVGILALLVVFTVSWQIINAKELKDGIKEKAIQTDKTISDIKTNFNKEIEILKNNPAIDPKGGRINNMLVLKFNSPQKNDKVQKFVEQYYNSLKLTASIVCVTSHEKEKNGLIITNGGLNDFYLQDLIWKCNQSFGIKIKYEFVLNNSHGQMVLGMPTK